MSLTYADISSLHQSGQTAEQIAGALANDWRTRSDIDIARLAGELLIPTGLYSAIESARETISAAAQLYDVVRERRIGYIRTASSPETAANIRAGLTGLIDGGLFDALPPGVTAQDVESAFYGLGGGLRFRKAGGETYTASDVQAVIDAEVRRVRVHNAVLAAQSAYAAGKTDAEIVAAFEGAME